jgi:beta-ribofuranosylaminobenzene 5'-phosphate synthase
MARDMSAPLARASPESSTIPAEAKSGSRPPPRSHGWGIRVTAASRLSFMMIDMNGEGGRRNGVASLSLKDPAFQAVVGISRRWSLQTDDNSMEYSEPIRQYLAKLRRHLQGPPLRVVIEKGLPPHSGFGSKTTTLLALGKAYAALVGNEVTTEELARMARRAGTSGASVNLIDHGGFVVDGGHRNPDGFDADPRRYLVPSRFAVTARKPPLLIRLTFPAWPILVILPGNSGLHGEAELEWFRQTLPIPAGEAHKGAHLILMRLAPAVAESDYESFCEALRAITHENYFKQAQIATQPGGVRRLLEDAAARADVDAIGMSSMGPMCFAFTRRPASVAAWLSSLQQEGVVNRFWFTSAQNQPATMDAAITAIGRRPRFILGPTANHQS